MEIKEIGNQRMLRVCGTDIINSVGTHILTYVDNKLYVLPIDANAAYYIGTDYMYDGFMYQYWTSQLRQKLQELILANELKHCTNVQHSDIVNILEVAISTWNMTQDSQLMAQKLCLSIGE